MAYFRRVLGDLAGPAFWVVLGCLVCQLGLGFSYAVKPLAGDIIEEFSWTRAMYFTAQSPVNITYALASFVVGALVYRFGSRKILIASILLLSVVFAFYSRMQSLLQLSALVIVKGIALTGLGDITVGQLVSQWVRKRRGLALGIVYTGSNLGAVLFIPFVVEIAERQSWRESLLALSMVGLFLMLPAALFLVREPRPGVIAEDAPGEGSTESSERDLSLKQAVRTRSFWILAASLFSFFFFFMSMLDHLILFLTDEGMERGLASSVLRNAIGLGIISKILLGALSDRIPKRSAIWIDFALLAFSSVVLLFLPGPSWVMWLFVVSFGFSAAARDVVYPLIVTECFGLHHMAPIYGGLMLAFLPGATLGPIFAAAVHDQTGSYAPCFVVFVVLNGLAVVALGFLRDEKIRYRESEAG